MMRFFLRLLVAATAFGVSFSAVQAAPAAPSPEPLHLAVLDPLCKELACPCVKGFAQRDYKALAAFLTEKLGRPVEFVPCETLADANQRTQNKLDLVIGKQSVIQFDARHSGATVHPLAMLTDREGKTTLTGLFIVRSDAPQKTIADLAGRKILFGPPECDEKYAAPLAAMKAAGVPVPAKPETRQGCDGTVLEVGQKKADAGIISSYAIKLLEGCGTIDKGALRIIGETAPVPFITVFATKRVNAEEAKAVTAALLEVGKHRDLRKKLESRAGFVAMPATK